MPSEESSVAEPPRPSVFLSYASADRAAARALKDTLSAAGLDVWLDEEELGGGEAWDAKIRNQIRTCTYFMPVISATTEIRREGYFRREWRFAVERTLDLADDVMFLVPVVIDDTRDAGARVPEKFFSVQWLRVPGGQATPALVELARKLANGEAVAVHPASADAVPAVPRSEKKPRERDRTPPPPFPAFPAYPEHGSFFRFLYELVLWAGRVLHSLWGHLPRFVRVLASIVIIFNLISWIFRDRPRAAAARQEKIAAVADVTKAVDAALHESKVNDKGAAAEALKNIVGAVADAAQAGKPLAVVNFAGTGDEAEAYASAAFDVVCEQLQPEGADKISVSPLPLDEGFTDAEAVLRGARLKSQFVLTGQVRRDAPGQPLRLTVKLYDVKQGTLLWTESYDVAQVDAPTAAQRVAAEVRQRTVPVVKP